MSLTKEEVKHLSKLARIKLSEAEAANFASELSPFVTMMDRLREVDTTGVPAMSHVLDLENVMRDDEPEERWSQRDALQQVADSEDGFIRVPFSIE